MIRIELTLTHRAFYVGRPKGIPQTLGRFVPACLTQPISKSKNGNLII
jgi:hypothetical protein